jgi:hypothetical protein
MKSKNKIDLKQDKMKDRCKSGLTFHALDSSHETKNNR